MNGSTVFGVSGESSAEFQGRGDSVGCSGIAGWVLDSKHPNRNIPLELYADLVAAALAEAKRNDGSYGFQVRLPKRLLDGVPHAVNVRFAGTSTAVNYALGTINLRQPRVRK